MKDTKLLLIITAGLIAVLLFTSCSTMKNNDFSRQKYTHFKKGESTVILNKTVKEKKEVDKNPVNTNTTEIAEDYKLSASATIGEQADLSNKMPDQKIVSESGITVTNVRSEPNEAIKSKINRKETSFRNSLFKSSSTKSVNDGSVNLLVLVILSILLPPLAVFLARGLNTPFWIDLILTIIFWIPGVIYALLIVCNAI